MIVRYTPKSLEDLRKIKGYIEEILCNQIAAKNTTNKIIKMVSKLKRHPLLGMSLEDKIGQPSQLRYLIF